MHHFLQGNNNEHVDILPSAFVSSADCLGYEAQLSTTGIKTSKNDGCDNNGSPEKALGSKLVVGHDQAEEAAIKELTQLFLRNNLQRVPTIRSPVRSPTESGIVTVDDMYCSPQVHQGTQNGSES